MTATIRELIEVCLEEEAELQIVRRKGITYPWIEAQVQIQRASEGAA